MRIGLWVSLGVALAGCGKPMENQSLSANVEIVSDPNLFKSVAMVSLPGGNGICTGTFISPRALLTAAHCVQNSGRYQAYTNFGTFSTYVREALGPGELDDPLDVAILVFSEDVARRASKQISPLGSGVSGGDKIQIVGFGCNDINTRRGAGAKRAGTNHVSSVDDYIELSTPFSSSSSTQSSSSSRPILGPNDQAGSCFGDSGGPMFRADSGTLVGVTHAGGTSGSRIISQYINLGRSDIQSFIHSVDEEYDLGIYNVCEASDPYDGAPCTHTASLHIMEELRGLVMGVWNWVLKLWAML